MLLRSTMKSVLVATALSVLSLGLNSAPALADTSHTVRGGESLYTISLQYGVTVNAIKSANGLMSDVIYPGQVLIIRTSTALPSGGSYTVRPGDSLYLIASRYGVSVAQLKSVNGLTSDTIYVGQRLVIPGGNPATPPGGQSSNSKYVVKAGDSLYKIAHTHGVTVESLKAANGLKTNTIYVGQVLLIPNQSGPKNGSSGSISDSDRDLLARLVEAEASGEPFEGKVAVAATVLNRVASSAYPETIPGVIFQVIDGKYYQYEPVLNGTIYNPASAEAFRAVDAALSGWDPTYGAIGFYNPNKTANQWVRSRPVTVQIGNHVFFR